MMYANTKHAFLFKHLVQLKKKSYKYQTFPIFKTTISTKDIKTVHSLVSKSAIWNISIMHGSQYLLESDSVWNATFIIFELLFKFYWYFVSSHWLFNKAIVSLCEISCPLKYHTQSKNITSVLPFVNLSLISV
jgi:hypothetical protein